MISTIPKEDENSVAPHTWRRTTDKEGIRFSLILLLEGSENAFFSCTFLDLLFSSQDGTGCRNQKSQFIKKRNVLPWIISQKYLSEANLYLLIIINNVLLSQEVHRDQPAKMRPKFEVALFLFLLWLLAFWPFRGLLCRPIAFRAVVFKAKEERWPIPCSPRLIHFEISKGWLSIDNLRRVEHNWYFITDWLIDQTREIALHILIHVCSHLQDKHLAQIFFMYENLSKTKTLFSSAGELWTNERKWISFSTVTFFLPC